MNPAQRSRLVKEKRPSDYCPVKGCLWRVYPGRPCGKHTPLIKLKDCETEDLASDYDEWVASEAGQ